MRLPYMADNPGRSASQEHVSMSCLPGNCSLAAQSPPITSVGSVWGFSVKSPPAKSPTAPAVSNLASSNAAVTATRSCKNREVSCGKNYRNIAHERVYSVTVPFVSGTIMAVGGAIAMTLAVLALFASMFESQLIAPKDEGSIAGAFCGLACIVVFGSTVLAFAYFVN